jgi:FMN phosphatase YigB (HAD superfamily)
MMVGDKPEADLKLAKKLGMKTVWIVKGDWALKRKNKRFSYVDCRINSLKQLLRYF